jgi:hypothetical protein
MKTNMKLKSELQKLSACSDAISWAGDKTLAEAWATCERGDWMLWLYVRSKEKDFRKLTLTKGHCANLAREWMKDERSRNAVDVSIAYGNNEATDEQLRAAAAAAADAADAAYAADAAAAYAAYAADAAAAYAADAAYAAAYAAAAYAAYAAAAAYANAAYAANAADAANARKESLQKSADICRLYLPIPVL